MQINGTRIIAPSRYPNEGWSEAEVLGGCIWLWNQHPYYRQGSVESALEVLSPIIGSRNFCFFVKDQQPLGYVNWAFLNAQDEQAYMHTQQPYTFFTTRHYPPGTAVRFWMLSWFFPAGGSSVAKRLLKHHILREETMHFLYHKPAPGHFVHKSFSGAGVQRLVRSTP